MKTSTPNRRTPALALAAVVSVLGLSACTSIGYRCPLEPGEEAASPTACASMQKAMAGAKKGTGGTTSVLVDDEGRIVPIELLEKRPAKPIQGGFNREPYRQPSGAPAFEQPKVFQAWSGAFVDDKGNLHDGHHAWFATPGRWAYGTVDTPGTVGDNLLRPAGPAATPVGRVVKTERQGVSPQAPAGAQSQARPNEMSPQDREKAALNNLSAAANSVASKQLGSAKEAGAGNPAAGVTAPALQLAQ